LLLLLLLLHNRWCLFRCRYRCRCRCLFRCRYRWRNHRRKLFSNGSVFAYYFVFLACQISRLHVRRGLGHALGWQREPGAPPGRELSCHPGVLHELVRGWRPLPSYGNTDRLDSLWRDTGLCRKRLVRRDPPRHAESPNTCMLLLLRSRSHVLRCDSTSRRNRVDEDVLPLPVPHPSLVVRCRGRQLVLLLHGHLGGLAPGGTLPWAVPGARHHHRNLRFANEAHARAKAKRDGQAGLAWVVMRMATRARACVRGNGAARAPVG